MTSLEAAQIVVDQKQCHLLRVRKNDATQYDAKPYGEGSKRGWFYLDGFTASAIIKVYSACNETNQAKLRTLSIEKLASVCFKFVK